MDVTDAGDFKWFLAIISQKNKGLRIKKEQD